MTLYRIEQIVKYRLRSLGFASSRALTHGRLLAAAVAPGSPALRRVRRRGRTGSGGRRVAFAMILVSCVVRSCEISPGSLSRQSDEVESNALFADLVLRAGAVVSLSLSLRSSAGLVSFLPRLVRGRVSSAGDSASSSSSFTLSTAALCSRTDLDTTSSRIPLDGLPRRRLSSTGCGVDALLATDPARREAAGDPSLCRVVEGGLSSLLCRLELRLPLPRCSSGSGSGSASISTSSSSSSCFAVSLSSSASSCSVAASDCAGSGDVPRRPLVPLFEAGAPLG